MWEKANESDKKITIGENSYKFVFDNNKSSDDNFLDFVSLNAEIGLNEISKKDLFQFKGYAKKLQPQFHPDKTKNEPKDIIDKKTEFYTRLNNIVGLAYGEENKYGLDFVNLSEIVYIIKRIENKPKDFKNNLLIGFQSNQDEFRKEFDDYIKNHGSEISESKINLMELQFGFITITPPTNTNNISEIFKRIMGAFSDGFNFVKNLFVSLADKFMGLFRRSNDDIKSVSIVLAGGDTINIYGNDAPVQMTRANPLAILAGESDPAATIIINLDSTHLAVPYDSIPRSIGDIVLNANVADLPDITNAMPFIAQNISALNNVNESAVVVANDGNTVLNEISGLDKCGIYGYVLNHETTNLDKFKALLELAEDDIEYKQYLTTDFKLADSKGEDFANALNSSKPTQTTMFGRLMSYFSTQSALNKNGVNSKLTGNEQIGSKNFGGDHDLNEGYPTSYHTGKDKVDGDNPMNDKSGPRGPLGQ